MIFAKGDNCWSGAPGDILSAMYVPNLNSQLYKFFTGVSDYLQEIISEMSFSDVMNMFKMSPKVTLWSQTIFIYISRN